MSDFPDSALGRILKKKILEGLILNNRWFVDLCLWKIPRLDKEKTYTGEDLRFILTALYGKPKNPNLWGAIVHKAQIDGLIEPVSREGRMKDPTSHARMTSEYKIV